VSDAISNDIEIVRNGEYCLMYDKPLGASGVSWRDLTAWFGNSLTWPASTTRKWLACYTNVCFSR